MSEDLIRRQDARNAVRNLGDDYVARLKMLLLIEELPSAESERTAKVIELDKRSETMMGWEGKCSNCGSYTIHEMDYCHGCGARLEWE